MQTIRLVNVIPSSLATEHIFNLLPLHRLSFIVLSREYELVWTRTTLEAVRACFWRSRDLCEGWGGKLLVSFGRLVIFSAWRMQGGEGDDTVKVFEHWGQNSNMIRYNIGALSSEFFCGWGPRFRIAGM